MNSSRVKTLIWLQVLLMVYSLNSIFSKLASRENSINLRFILLYGCVVFLLALYAVGWQQIIKRLPLTVAFANKAITIVWGLVWGFLFFNESITIGKIIGVVIVITGVILYVVSDKEESNG